ncbi:hypothetical protein [Devosia sp. FKR38]|uniref:hypothetical protein n=1 Tax=Devosia sp. FKR38 TaxID=2562312 RepID=UPI0010C1514D|nr:hypothetical protein [Devosia sp. FKR38]
MRITKTTSLMLLSGVATAMLIGQASALEAQAFVDRVAAVYKTIGYDFKFGPATLDGDTVTVQGITIGLVAATPDMKPMTFDTEITFSGVAEYDDGSYTADSVTIPDIDTDFATDPVGHITLADARIDGLYIPGGETVPAAAVLQMVQSISTGALSVTRDGQEVISIESMEAATEFTPEQGSAELTDLSSTLAVNGISVDLSTVGEEDAQAGAVIEALGLTSISGNITQDLTWSMADGHMVLHSFLLDFADVGSLDIAADLTGLTPAVLDQMYAMQAATPTEGKTAEELAQAQMMSSMALMQGVSIVSAKVRYDDASLAGKLLDFFAQQSGTDRATFVAGLKAALPAMIADTGIPALTDLVYPPVSTFLDDPQSLEVRVAPPQPTSILVLAAAAANPAGLIAALGLAVEANTAAAE